MEKENIDIIENLEEISKSIKKVSELGSKLKQSNLNERCINLLVSKISGVSQTNVKLVLWSLDKLEEKFLEPIEKRN